jgi:hypothetical protein
MLSFILSDYVDTQMKATNTLVKSYTMSDCDLHNFVHSNNDKAVLQLLKRYHSPPGVLPLSHLLQRQLIGQTYPATSPVFNGFVCKKKVTYLRYVLKSQGLSLFGSGTPHIP